MDITTLEHFVIALAIAFIGWMIGDVYAGAALAVGIFAGREHSQAETRNIQANYNNTRATAPAWVGFQPRAWDIHSVMDVVGAVCGAGAVLAVYCWVRNS